jgi:AraC family transcriptional regulator of adaptative response/methylated-DNA-[protein]-cysteine methyltransferase
MHHPDLKRSAETIYFAVGTCTIGSVLAAQSAKGICAILLGDDAQALTQDLQTRFKGAQLIDGDEHFQQVLDLVVGHVNNPQNALALPLDIRGTPFQQAVWAALQEITLGSRATYTDVAHKLGKPKAFRAVALACAANALAVAIPCHRVVRSDGGLSGYRWGVERKQWLLEKELSLAL